MAIYNDLVGETTGLILWTSIVSFIYCSWFDPTWPFSTQFYPKVKIVSRRTVIDWAATVGKPPLTFFHADFGSVQLTMAKMKNRILCHIHLFLTSKRIELESRTMSLIEEIFNGFPMLIYFFYISSMLSKDIIQNEV